MNLPVVVVRSGPSIGQKIALDKDRLMVGRHIACDVRSDSFWLCSYHAQFLRTPEEFEVEDLYSSNGTFVNGHRVHSRLLRTTHS
jgi:pSer/pThr/pTyr-binding forkhead associated (FHA) protein